MLRDTNKTSTKLDCEQSLFSSKIRGEERKTSSCANVPVRVNLFCVLPRVWTKRGVGHGLGYGVGHCLPYGLPVVKFKKKNT